MTNFKYKLLYIPNGTFFKSAISGKDYLFSNKTSKQKIVNFLNNIQYDTGNGILSINGFPLGHKFSIEEFEVIDD